MKSFGIALWQAVANKANKTQRCGSSSERPNVQVVARQKRSRQSKRRCAQFFCKGMEVR